jgi:hypothetical protein
MTAVLTPTVDPEGPSVVHLLPLSERGTCRARLQIRLPPSRFSDILITTVPTQRSFYPDLS